LLGIMKTGAAYVPLDPDYPPERLRHMMEDSGMRVLLTQQQLLSRLPQQLATPFVTVLLDQLPTTGSTAQEHNPEVAVAADNLAYVIYTSGSTGKPKGVGISHAALSAHAQVSVGFFGLRSSDRMLQFSTLNFDGFVEQTWPALSIGAALVLRGPALWDSATLHAALHRYGITVADLTTAYWSLLVQDFARQAQTAGLPDYGQLRQVHAGGEAMPPEALHAWRAAGMEEIKLLNTYGPTEATVTATVHDCSALLASGRDLPVQMPIGVALPGRSLVVVDGNLDLVPAGVAGELCIGGDLLARGYLGRAALTAERFVPDPYGAAGQRLYRTGDLVRWQEGELVYLGRIDHQIKIRGFRVELGEIEAQLLAQEGVREAVVVAREGAAGMQLIAYVSPDLVDGIAIRERLKQSLPDYMVPAVVMTLARLPLNPAGKVNRQALPAPTLESEAYAPPQGELEQAVAAIWSDLLGVARIGRADSFFDLGGHSLLAMRAVVQVNRMLQALYVQDERSVTLAQLLTQPTLMGFCEKLLQGQPSVGNLNALRASGSGSPLFCCPGLLVNSFEFKGLSEALGAQQPVHAFISHALGPDRWRQMTVAELAAGYAERIVAQSAGRPCKLLGWSLGATLAQETARQLQGLVTVEMVGMLDPVLSQFDVADDSETVVVDPDIERALRQRWLVRSTMRQRWEQLFERMTAQEWALFVQRMATDVAAVDALPCDGDAVHCKEYLSWSVASHALMLRRHRPERSAATAHVWIAEETQRAGLRLFDSAACFSRVAQQTVVPDCDHLSIVRSPQWWGDMRQVMETL
jgi:amino acid adenylation domain-containing protein